MGRTGGLSHHLPPVVDGPGRPADGLQIDLEALGGGSAVVTDQLDRAHRASTLYQFPATFTIIRDHLLYDCLAVEIEPF